MHDARRVDGVERLGQPAARGGAVAAAASGPALADDVVEGGPGHVAGHEVGPVAVDVGVDDGGDPAVAACGAACDLARQAGAGVRVVRDVGAQHLDRDGPAVRVERRGGRRPCRPRRAARPAGTGRCASRGPAARATDRAAPGARRARSAPVDRPPRHAPTVSEGHRPVERGRGSLLDVPNELVALGLQLVDPVLDDVADADDRVQLPSTTTGTCRIRMSVIVRARSSMVVVGLAGLTSRGHDRR